MNIYPFQTKSKFAMVTVNNVYTDLPAAAFQLSDGTSVLPAVPVPDLGIWKEWIGSIRMERLGRANLVLFLEEPSDNPEILDAVHQRLDKDLIVYIRISGCRGRDTDRSAPPAQNRTSASTHTASTSDSGVETLHRIRVQDARFWNPSVIESVHLLP